MRIHKLGMVVLWGVWFAATFLFAPEPREFARSLAFGQQNHTDHEREEHPMNMSYDPAAPSISCDTSCHTQPAYRREEIHQTEACVACHMTKEQLRQEATRVASQPRQSESPPQAQKRRELGGYLVEDQDGARLRLKGKPMVLAKIDISVPDGMVYIPEGEFIMGTNTRWEDESPEHVVYLHGYFINRYEVTNADYKKFVDATGHRTPDRWQQKTYPKGVGHHPVTYVNWHDAMAYCRWAGKRLPTEQEWEKGARGADGRQYPWGDAFYEDRSNNPQRKSKGTEPVGSYENGKSPYGLYDMSGNVWEWVDAWYQPHAGNEVPSEEYGEKYKVSKGGSWYNCLFYNCGISAPSYNRAFLVPLTKNSSLGFRCVLSADAKK